MRWHLGATIVLAFVISACGHHGDGQHAQITRLERLTLHRSGCEGECPEYTVAVGSDGEVVFEGSRFVSITTAQARIAPLELRALTDALNEKRFVHFNDRYETNEDGCASHPTDHQTVTLTVNFDGRSKTVRNYLGCRQRQEMPRIREQPQPQSVQTTPLPPNPWPAPSTLAPGAAGPTPIECPYPLSLVHLEDRIDSILRTKRWTGNARPAYSAACAAQPDRR
jgi:Domain of unknown function (DUF6438)